jgi:hypothetical protein
MDYTKGEWKLDRRDIISGNKTIARLSQSSTLQDEVEVLANANLIIAAPDMYEALKILTGKHETSVDYGVAYREALKAIAKADGK